MRPRVSSASQTPDQPSVALGAVRLALEWRSAVTLRRHRVGGAALALAAAADLPLFDEHESGRANSRPGMPRRDPANARSAVLSLPPTHTGGFNGSTVSRRAGPAASILSPSPTATYGATAPRGEEFGPVVLTAGPVHYFYGRRQATGGTALSV
jgi:hypothetical protein